MSEALLKEHQEEMVDEPEGLAERIETVEERGCVLTMIMRALCLCGLRARNLHTAFS